MKSNLNWTAGVVLEAIGLVFLAVAAVFAVPGKWFSAVGVQIADREEDKQVYGLR